MRAGKVWRHARLGVAKSALVLCAAWSHLALAQDVTVQLGLGNNESFDLTVTNGGTAPIDVFDIDIGSSVFDTINGSSTVPDVGGNNDGQQSGQLTVTPNSPIDPGSTWVGSGDIDSGVPTIVMVTVAGVQFQLFSSQAGLFAGSAGLPTGIPGEPDPSDMCEGSALDTGGCIFFRAATVYAYTGDPRTLSWQPHPDDVFRGDRMFYFTEIRTWPLDNLVIALQTAVAETEFFWTPNAVGFYHAKVQACDPDLIESGDIVDTIPSEHCSDWADSMNDQNTPAELPGWMVYVAIKPPSGGGIE